jgi:PAS domain S-box-containing protein
VLIPLVTGWIRLYGEVHGLYSSGMGVALFAIFNIVLFLFVIWRSVLSVNLSNQSLENEVEERKKAEGIIHENQQLLKDLYDNAPSGYYSLDREGRFINANNTTLQWLGYDKDELLEKKITDILTPEGREVFKSRFPMFKKTGSVNDLELVYTRKDGTFFPVLINSSAVMDNTGNFLYSRSSIFDISERKRLEEEIKRSNTFLDTILESIPHMVFVKDAKDLRFEKFNRAGEELLGLSKKEVLGKSDYDFFSKENADYFTATDREVLKKGVLFDIPEELIHTPGGERWLHTKKIPIRGENGAVKHLLGVSEDITERKKLEDSLRTKNEIFLQLFYASPLAMVIRKIEDGIILDVNAEYERLLGIGKEDLVGKASIGMGMTLDPAFSTDLKNSISEEGSIRNVEALLYNSRKEQVNVIVSIEKIRLGNTDCLISALLDITERKKLEENLSTVNKELESFTYSVSHDLRAPLRIINGYAQMIMETPDNLGEEHKRMLGNIMVNTKRMGNLIDDLLNFSRLGRRELIKHVTDMDLLVNEIIQAQLIMNPACTIRKKELPVCTCDSSLIKQVWENLISNAIKYSSRKPAPVIEIGSLIINNETIYYIRDNGAGFDMKYYDKLFGVFQRLHKASEFEGTGVGLALSHRILVKHGGRIWAESKKEEGSTFYFTVGKS